MIATSQPFGVQLHSYLKVPQGLYRAGGATYLHWRSATFGTRPPADQEAAPRPLGSPEEIAGCITDCRQPVLKSRNPTLMDIKPREETSQ